MATPTSVTPACCLPDTLFDLGAYPVLAYLSLSLSVSVTVSSSVSLAVRNPTRVVRPSM